MSENHDLESLGSEIINILDRFNLPSNNFAVELHLSTLAFYNISITWQNFSQVEKEAHIPEIDFSYLAEQMCFLYKSYNYNIENYIVIIKLPYQIFDAYVNEFQEKLDNPSAIRKTGNTKDVSWQYVLQRRKILGSD